MMQIDQSEGNRIKNDLSKFSVLYVGMKVTWTPENGDRVPQGFKSGVFLCPLDDIGNELAEDRDPRRSYAVNWGNWDSWDTAKDFHSPSAFSFAWDNPALAPIPGGGSWGPNRLYNMDGSRGGLKIILTDRIPRGTSWTYKLGASAAPLNGSRIFDNMDEDFPGGIAHPRLGGAKGSKTSNKEFGCAFNDGHAETITFPNGANNGAEAQSVYYLHRR